MTLTRSHLVSALLSAPLLVASLVSVSGCSTSDESHEPVVSQLGSKIQGGVADPNDPNVVGIYNASIGGLCSGSLLAPNLVLTARHCVAETIAQPGLQEGAVICTTQGSNGPTKFSPPVAASNMYITTEAQPGFNSPNIQGSKIFVPEDPQLCGNDLALIILKSNFDASDATPLVPRVDSHPIPDEVYRAVGFGATDSSGNGAGQRRLRENLHVKCDGGACPSYHQVADTEWEGETGICSGDSGGPALDSLNRVMGVVSRGGQSGATCTMPTYGGVATWADWIKQIAAQAATEGGYEPAPWVNGSPTDPVGGTGGAGGAGGAAGEGGSAGIGDGGTGGDVAAGAGGDVGTAGVGTAGTGAAVSAGGSDAAGTTHAGGASSKPLSNGASSDSGGCSIGVHEPVKPVPWRIAPGLVIALGAVLRRGRSRRDR